MSDIKCGPFPCSKCGNPTGGLHCDCGKSLWKGYRFDSKKVRHEIVAWIRDWFEKNAHPNAPAIIGLSGGKDSNICAALLVEALGVYRVIGVSLATVKEEDIDPDVHKITAHLGITTYFIDISNITAQILGDVSPWIGDATSQTVENIPPRVRMTYLYAIASVKNGRVCNCSNASEDYVGYTTKWGSNTGDFAPIADLTVSEVKAIGKELRLPKKLVNKTPHDGLQALSDEEKLGIKYAEIDDFIRNGVDTEWFGLLDDSTIFKLHKANKHKFEPIPKYKYN